MPKKRRVEEKPNVRIEDVRIVCPTRDQWLAIVWCLCNSYSSGCLSFTPIVLQSLMAEERL